ncbi:MAG: LysR family transcriptional regulator [Youngiibacter sp.]|nr:LysR family transcriptional regulator [Youngiibacter sp.]
MNTKAETYFIEIAKQKSISKAAERLFVSQSTLSQFLLNLEKELGVLLIERGKQELVLTPAGAIYLEGAKEILNIKEQVYLSIQDSKISGRNKWRIGITSRESLNLFLEGARRFREIKTDIVFDIVEDNVRPVLKMLEAGNINMAILTLTDRDEVKEHWELLKKEEILLAIPKGTTFQGESDGLKDLSRYKFILAKQGTAFRALEDAILIQAGVTPQIAFEINNTEAVKELVMGGLGFSFIPASTAKAQDSIEYFSINPPVYRYHVLGFNGGKLQKEPLEVWISILKDVADKSPNRH